MVNGILVVSPCSQLDLAMMVTCTDRYVRWLGVGTAADHHVHHKLFKYNYGHLFMW